MAVRPRVTAFRRLGWPDRALVVEALVVLAAARAALLLVPFRRLVPHLGPTTTEAPPEGVVGRGEPARIGRAVATVSRAVPWRTACLTEAIATQWMLRRRSFPSVLHLGVRKEGDAMTAHAWISCRGENVIGGAGAEDYTPLAAFGSVT